MSFFFTHDTVSHKVTSGRSVMIRLYVNSVYIGNPEIFQRIVHLIFFKSFNMYSDCETNIGKVYSALNV